MLNLVEVETDDNVLSDSTTVVGIPWSVLKLMLSDPSFDYEAFLSSLTADQVELLERLELRE